MTRKRISTALGLCLTFVLLLSFCMPVDAQVVKKPVTKKKLIKKKPLKIQVKKLVITGIVVVVNCVDRYIEVLDIKTCKKYKVNLDPAKCRQLRLKYWDKVRVTTDTSMLVRNVTNVRGVRIIKIPWRSLEGVVTTLNCVDHYIDIRVTKCNRNVVARIYFGTTEACRRYNVQAGNRIRVFGTVAHERQRRPFKLTVSNVTKIDKL